MGEKPLYLITSYADAQTARLLCAYYQKAHILQIPAEYKDGAYSDI